MCREQASALCSREDGARKTGHDTVLGARGGLPGVNLSGRTRCVVI
jgi:hypothetical protein